MFKKNEGSAVVGGKIDNVLGPNTSFQGHMKLDGNVRVDGVFEGSIETAGNVIIGPSARIMADITANAVQVWGAVRGNVTAQGRLEILPSGRLWGDIRVASLLIDEGGVFRGQCTMAGDDVEADLGHGQPHEPRPAAQRRHARHCHRAAHSSRPTDHKSQPKGSLMGVGLALGQSGQILLVEDGLHGGIAHPAPTAFFAIRPATYPPLNPASMFTTVTFDAQLLSIPNNAATPPKLAP